MIQTIDQLRALPQVFDASQDEETGVCMVALRAGWRFLVPEGSLVATLISSNPIHTTQTWDLNDAIESMLHVIPCNCNGCIRCLQPSPFNQHDHAQN